MKEELINKILGRVKLKKEKLESLDEIVLECLCFIRNDDDLRDILFLLLGKFDPIIILGHVEAYKLNIVNVIKLIISDNNYKLAKEAINKMSLAKYDFQIKYIDKIYGNDNIEYKGLIADVILKCSKEFQTYAIYDFMASMEYEEKDFAEYLELAEIIAKEKDEYKVKIYTNLDWYLDVLDLGLLIPVAKLISKCKCEAQVENMYHYLDNLYSKNAPLVLKNCEYFLRTTDKDKLNSLYTYLTNCLNQNLLVEEEKINLIINARKKYNSDAIRETLALGPLIDTSLDGEAIEVLSESRKEYNAKYAKSLVNIGSVSGLSGAMIVNESETKYKAEQVHSLISLYANTDEIDESLEFASLINSVYTKTEIDLIYLLGLNGYLNKLGIALPIARVIADATDCEEDIEKIKECLKNEKNIVKAIKGFIYLIKCIDLNDRQKAENIINKVLLKTQNRPIHIDFIEEKEPTLNNIKIPTPIRTLSDKTNKKY